MNEVNEDIKQRRERKSVRVSEDKVVPDAVKNDVIVSSIEAPTAGNMMFYTIIDVTDQKVKDQLSVLCDHQPFIAKASLVLVFLADYQRWYETYRAAGIAVRTP